MRRQPMPEDNDRKPTEPTRPVLPKRPDRTPGPDRTPRQLPDTPSQMPPRGAYPPGTIYNPIGVPPYGEQPIMRPPTDTPYMDFPVQPAPPVTTDRNYIQGYLKTIIGRYVRVEFILGTNMFIDREGTLVDVGVDHIVLRESETDDLVLADLYSIKFVRVYF